VVWWVRVRACAISVSRNDLTQRQREDHKGEGGDGGDGGGAGAAYTPVDTTVGTCNASNDVKQGEHYTRQKRAK
jgi:hypothetical protein